ncbi:unnamed protein product [Pocillopora meandrina]|uniref:Uncharacterized protein n=1 Tax=Pocillopora meandrina TaxID=46732 RepID=A0AAU9X8E1_9CNID|nr:unnamed protein product [Pocillopora meandrina]
MENTNPFQRQNDFEMSVRGGIKAAGEDVSQDITDDEDKTYSIRHLILDYCEYTSGHGPPRIIASKQTIRKIFWTLLFLAALAMSSWQINTLFNTYKARPLSTHVSIKHETSLDFPVITICNFNAVKIGNIENFPEELKKDIQAETTSSNPPTRGKRAVNQPSSSNSPNNLDFFEEEEEEGIENPDDLDEDFKNREQMIMIMAEAGVEALKPLGHQFKEFVLSCRYRGISCGNFASSYWTSYWHYTYGNCYVFNAGKDKSGNRATVLKSNKPGPSHGLNLELNIEQDEYIGAFTEEAGVRIDISNQGEMSFPREKGLSAAPGFATSIGIRKVEIHRKDPFTKKRCQNSSSLSDANLYKHNFQVNYSATACKESCLAYNQRKECKCMEYRFPLPNDKTPVCDILNKTVVDCLSKVQKAFKRNELNCTLSCPPPCRESIFQLTSSFSAWPSSGYKPFYIDKLNSQDKSHNLDINSNSSNLRSNVLKLNIFYEELNYETITEERSYELANFVSDLGGSLGLWIGMSVLSFAEVLELLLLIGYALFRKFRRKLNGKIQSSSFHGKGKGVV